MSTKNTYDTPELIVYCPYMLECIFYRQFGKGSYLCNQDPYKNKCPEYCRKSYKEFKKYELYP